jgi:hypothetical protein
MGTTHFPRLVGVLSESWIAGDERPRIVVDGGHAAP